MSCFYVKCDTLLYNEYYFYFLSPLTLYNVNNIKINKYKIEIQ